MRKNYVLFLWLFLAAPLLGEKFIPLELGPGYDEQPKVTRSAENSTVASRAGLSTKDPFKGDVGDGDYQLRVGDSLRISMYGEDNSERVVTIDSHGEFAYRLVGRVHALGKTINQLRNEINDSMQENLRFSLVNVVPERFDGLHYTILGQVESPGKKTIRGPTTLVQALAASGGFRMGFFRSGTVDLADFRYAFVSRNGEYVPVDFYSLVVEGDMSQNIAIQNGDYIYIPNALQRQIYVLGEVNLPANIGYLNSQTLVGAISEARGLTAVASRKAFIIRGSLSEPQKIEADLHDLFRGLEPDILLKPGDIVYVPSRKSLFGEDIFKTAIRSFVWASAHVLGVEAFQEVHPHRSDDDQRSDPF